MAPSADDHKFLGRGYGSLSGDFKSRNLASNDVMEYTRRRHRYLGEYVHIDVSDQFTAFGKWSVSIIYFAYWVFLMFPNWFLPIGRPGIAAKMFKVLADAKINIQMISTSEVKVSCVIDESECDRALHLLSQAFDIDLGSQKEITANQYAGEHPAVRGVALDEDQARIAIRQVPDTPGMAAQIFSLLAQKNISVDAIIQSQRCHVIEGVPTRDIAFTVEQNDADLACQVINELNQKIGCGEASGDKAIAKLSVVGAGMIGRPGVAAQFFAALAQEQINIQMITTSEIKISCVIDNSQGVQALQAVHEAFGLGGTEEIKIPQ